MDESLSSGTRRDTAGPLRQPSLFQRREEAQRGEATCPRWHSQTGTPDIRALVFFFLITKYLQHTEKYRKKYNGHARPHHAALKPSFHICTLCHLKNKMLKKRSKLSASPSGSLCPRWEPVSWMWYFHAHSNSITTNAIYKHAYYFLPMPKFYGNSIKLYASFRHFLFIMLYFWDRAMLIHVALVYYFHCFIESILKRYQHLLIYMSGWVDQGQQTFSGESQMISILGFVGQTLCCDSSTELF